MTRPHVIFIDWDQTLNFFRFWGHWRETRPTDWQVIQQTLFGPTNKEMIRAWMRGHCSAEQIVDWLAVNASGGKPGLLPEALLSELRRSCELESFTDPATAELIAELRRRGHLVVIATDNMDTFTRWTVPATKLTDHVNGILNSFELGVLKTDVAPDGSLPFFAKFLAEQHLAPSDCVIVDDSTNIQRVAQAAGFHSRLVTPHQPVGRHLQNLLG